MCLSAGKVLAVSVNNIKLFEHGAIAEVRDQVDLDSDLAIYDLALGRCRSRPSWPCPTAGDVSGVVARRQVALLLPGADALAKPSRSDGDIPPHDPARQVQGVKYDLMRISYDADTGALERCRQSYRAAQAGRSVLEPKVSPDKRFVLLAMCNYGDVPIYRKDGDLCLLDVGTGQVADARQVQQRQYRGVALLVEQRAVDHVYQQTR